MYLDSSFVKRAFVRLRSSSRYGKSHLEKTSALILFLAFAALSKRKDSMLLEFPPKSYNRRLLEDEFRKLVELEERAQVMELGRVDYACSKNPEKRLESNFLTSQLKKASTSVCAMDYPRRPKPLLRIGKVAANTEWGIIAHPNWKENISAFFSETSGNTPFTDLVVFIFRYDEFEKNKGVWDSILENLSRKYPEDVAEFFKQKISAEKTFVKHLHEPIFEDARENLSRVLRDDSLSVSCPANLLRACDKDALIQRILYLEGILNGRGIIYEKRQLSSNEQ